MNKITVTITDNEDVKHYSFNKFVKKILFYSIIFLVVFFFSAVGTIIYLNHNLNVINQKKTQLQQENDTLAQKNAQLSKALLSKKMELEELSESIAQIEKLIGLTPDDNLSLQERVDITHLTSEQMAVLLRFIPNGSPIPFKGITGAYGNRVHPINGSSEFHTGIDLRAKRGTPVSAPADGVVEFAGYNSGYGKLIIIENNYGFKTYFGHLSKIKVKSRQFVKKGQLIGYTGNSGLSNGPHLHYEIRFLQRPLNPYHFMKWKVNDFDYIFKKEKRVPWKSLIEITADLQINKQIKAPQLLPMIEQKK